MDRIQATDSRVLPFTAEKIMPVLLDASTYPRWWPSAIAFTLLKQTADGVGSEFEIRPYGSHAFRCRIERIDGLKRIETRYYEGVYAGTGAWTLTPEGTGTRVEYSVDLEIKSFAVKMMARMVDVGKLHSKLMSEVFTGLEKVVAGP